MRVPMFWPSIDLWAIDRDVLKPMAPARRASRVSCSILAIFVFGGLRLLIGASLPHDEGAQRRMPDMGADIDRERPSPKRVEVVRKALPIPLEAFGQGRAGNVLDTLQQPDQAIMVPGMGRRETDAAIARPTDVTPLIRRPARAGWSHETCPS